MAKGTKSKSFFSKRSKDSLASSAGLGTITKTSSRPTSPTGSIPGRMSASVTYGSKSSGGKSGAATNNTKGPGPGPPGRSSKSSGYAAAKAAAAKAVAAKRMSQSTTNQKGLRN